MKANVYVDGFNLYYSALRWRFPGCKWLDVRKLAELLLPNDDIAEVKYFTARVSSEPDNPNQHRRQQSYLRALAATTWLPWSPTTLTWSSPYAWHETSWASGSCCSHRTHVQPHG